MGNRTSLAKVEANRRNAALSTGPKTPQGKSAVKWNALKHGLLAKEVIIDGGDGKESGAEFRALLSALLSDLQPVGVVEQMLVEKIAVCYWRLRRALRAEVGEVRERLDTYMLDQEIRRTGAVETALMCSPLTGKGCASQLARTTRGIEHLLGIIDELRYDVEENGAISEDAREELLQVFGRDKGSFGVEICVYDRLANRGRQPELGSGGEDAGSRPDPERCRAVLLKRLAEMESGLKEMMEMAGDAEALKDGSRAATLALPPEAAVQKILRYETTIERQLYRALDQLERLQRQRRGECTPPPIKVQLGEDG